MKKWLLLLVGLLCCASLAWAGFGYQVQMAGSVPAVGASYACDASTADICEDWDDADTFRLTWTDVTAGGTISAAAHSGTLSCTDKGSQAITVTYSSQADLYTSTNLGSAQNTVYINFYFIVTAHPNMAAGNTQALLIGSSGANGQYPGLKMQFREGSGDQLEISVHYDSTQVGSYVSIADNQWYRLSALYSTDNVDANGNDVIRWWLDGSQQAEVTNANFILTRRPQYFTISNNAEVAGSVGVSFQIDNFEVDYAEMPAACP